VLAATVAVFLVVTLCGFDAGTQLTYNPAHYENNDPIWDLLNKATVVSDMAKGEYSAKFPATLVALQSKPFRISGFITPLETSRASTHFLLVRRNTGCPFCPPNAPTEAIEVLSQTPIKYTGEEIALVGHFKLISSSAEGLFYRLDDAEITDRRG
jgi:hypothetical protein